MADSNRKPETQAGALRRLMEQTYSFHEGGFLFDWLKRKPETTATEKEYERYERARKSPAFQALEKIFDRMVEQRGKEIILKMGVDADQVEQAECYAESRNMRLTMGRKQSVCSGELTLNVSPAPNYKPYIDFGPYRLELPRVAEDATPPTNYLAVTHTKRDELGSAMVSTAAFFKNRLRMMRVCEVIFAGREREETAAVYKEIEEKEIARLNERCQRCNHTREDHEDSISGECNYSKECGSPTVFRVGGVAWQTDKIDLVAPCTCRHFIVPCEADPLSGNYVPDWPWKHIKFSIDLKDPA